MSASNITLILKRIAMMPIKKSDKVFSLRLPVTMYDYLKEQAEKQKRSVNAEILIALEQYIDRMSSITCDEDSDL